MTGSEVFAVVVGIIAAMLLGGAIAGPTGTLLGFLFSVVPVLIVLMSRSRKKPAPGPEPAAEAAGGDRMSCPRCGESIPASARVCRFCGHEL
jgi:hypothetical protein